MARRCVTAVAAVLLVAFTLTGCFYRTSTRVGGLTGVGVDAAGRPVLVVAVCNGQLENVFLDQDGRTGDVGEWQAVRVSPPQVVSVAVLTDPGRIWTVAAAPAALRASAHYTAFGQSTDTKWTTTPVHFSAADLRSLTPATVFSSRGTQPMSTFATTACTREKS